MAATNDGFEMDEQNNLTGVKHNGIKQGENKKESTRPDEKAVQDFDDLLHNVVGGSGRFQKFFLYLILGPITACMPFFALSTIFILSEPDHWCHVPGSNVSIDGSYEFWKNETIPRENGPDGKDRFSQCSMYSTPGNTSGGIVECQYGYDFDKSDFESTIPTEFEWVCDKKTYATTALTMQTVGSVLGILVFGYLADRIGRKPVFFATVVMDATFRILSLFVPQNFTLFLICQFLMGTASPLVFLAPTIIAAEFSGREYRSWIYSYSWQIWVLGMAFLPFVAWITRNWFTLGLITASSSVVLLLFYPFVPESPRFLTRVGRTKDAAKIMHSIAKKNGTSDKLSQSEIEGHLNRFFVKEENDAKANKYVGFWTLFSKKRNMGQLLLLFPWLLPNLPLLWYVLDTLVKHAHQVIRFIVAFTMIAFKYLQTFLIVYLQGAEIFPTDLRSSGSSFASLIATVVNVAGPYMIYLGRVNVNLPYVAIGIMSIIGLLASAFIPETLNRNLPETVHQANDLGRYDKFWGLGPKQKCTNSSKNNNK